MTIIGWIIIAVLVLAEVNHYRTPTFKEHMAVDATLGEKLKVNLNITFHALNCAEAHLDAMDVAGDNQLNVEHFMIKQRVAKDGISFGKSGIELIGEGVLNPKEHAPMLDPNYCGPCYGADTENVTCCNSCDDLIRAYQKKSWSIDSILRNSTQCLRDRATQFVDVNHDEGCTISGTMKVNKVAGNFHIAHGESIVRDGRHIHQFNPLSAPKYNISHTINSISFGDEYPSMPPHALDKIKKIIAEDENTGLFQYFIRVIPTVYSDESGTKIYTNQYTFTEKFRPLTLPKVDPDGTHRPVEAILPGIFFVYELSPFMIEASRTRIPLLHFFTKILSIVGGVFTVMGVIDSIIYKLQRLK